MQLNQFLAELKHKLQPEDLAPVVSALRHDALVWDKVGQPEFISRFLGHAENRAEMWNPASLALEALGQDIPLSSLRSQPLQPLQPDLRQMAARAYEETFRNGKIPSTLEQAGLLALALRERRRLTDTWQGLISELQLSASKGTFPVQVWLTPIACLYAMAPDSEELLASLLPRNPGLATTDQIHLVLHAILSNPLSIDEQVGSLQALLEPIPVEGQLAWLSQLQAAGENELATHLAEVLLRSPAVKSITRRIEQVGKTSCSDDPLAATIPADVIVARTNLASLHQVAGRPGDALPLLESARESLRQMQARLSLEIAQSASKKSEPLVALSASEQAFNLAPNSTLARSNYADSLMRAGHPQEALSLLGDDDTHPFNLLTGTHLAARNGDLDQARQKLMKLAAQLNNPEQSPRMDSDLYIDLVQSLYDLNLYEDAISAAEQGLQQYPTNLYLLELLGNAQRAAGQPTNSAEVTSLAVALAPHNIQLHRILANAYEETGDWDQCLEERNQVLRMNTIPTVEDLLSVASSAVHAKRPEQAIPACQAILERDPDAGLAHAYYGEALALQGEKPAAINRLTQATLLAPDQSEPWLALANIHAASGDQRKALETLRSAAHAAPENPTIHLALAQACLSAGSPTEALPSLRRAAELSPDTASVALRLAQTLHDLGHLKEARKVLDGARFTWPTIPDLALLQAKTLIALDEPVAAIAALNTVLRSQPKTSEPYMLFGRTMVSLADRRDYDASINLDLAGARVALLKVMEFDPENYEARLLMAEAQAASGELQASLETYRELTEMEKANDPAWSWRIHLGMGKVAMALGQMDTAVAALQEAVQTRPDDLRIHQALAEAYHAARLTEEASVKARTALGMAPHSIPNLTWYAHLALNMKDEGEAINALEHAIELAPERADLKNQLALVELQINDKNAARKVLESVLILESVPASELRQAASIFSSLGDGNAALSCMMKAIQNTEKPSADLWAELADMHRRADDLTQAEEAMQNALDIRPDDVNLHVLYGNILAAQNKTQAAVSSYEQALRLLDMGSKGNPQPSPLPWKYIPGDAGRDQLHMQIANLLQEIGDLRSALNHAEQAIDTDPGSLAARYAAAKMALSLLEFEHAEQLAAWTPLTAGMDIESGEPAHVMATQITDPHSALKLLALQAELYLELGDNQAAKESLERARAISVEDSRILAAEARLAARHGELASGTENLELAVAQLNQLVDGTEDDYPSLAIAEAAVELYQWSTAMPLFEQAARSQALDPLAQLSLARALVKAAEAQRVYTALQASSHAPGREAFGEAAYQQFERAILAANRLSNSDLVSRWHKRGQAAFHPAEKTMKALQAVATSPDDLAALLAISIITEKPAPQELVNRYPNHPAVLLQKSLAVLLEKPDEAVVIAQALVSTYPGNPLYEALLAQAAFNTGNNSLAYQAIETALASWPDEPAWHALAAQVSLACSDTAPSLEHWKAAHNLDPENPEYPHALGAAYLRAGEIDLAIQTLNQAAQQDATNVNTWISLAQAYRQAGDYPHAVGCAERAAEISPNQVEPLLLSGEIALAAGQADLARTRAKAVLARSPNHSAATLLIARSQAKEGHTSEALATLEDALPMVLEPFELLLERTRLIQSIQGGIASLAAIQGLAAEYPEEPLAQAELAKALAEAGQKEAAEKAAQAALLLQPNLSGLHLLLGRIQRSSGQLDQAIYHLSEAIRQEPRNIEAYLELGRTHQERREHDQAVKIFQQAGVIAPRDARPTYQIGLALKETKDYENAEKMLRKAAELAPEDVNIRRQLAAIIAINLVHKPQEASISQ